MAKAACASFSSFQSFPGEPVGFLDLWPSKTVQVPAINRNTQDATAEAQHQQGDSYACP
jgi:hypothetical protein